MLTNYCHRVTAQLTLKKNIIIIIIIIITIIIIIITLCGTNSVCSSNSKFNKTHIYHYEHCIIRLYLILWGPRWHSG